MKLYYKAGACSLSPHIVLAEAGLDYSLEAVDLRTKKTEKDSDFWKINPNGYVPALLLDNGELLTEGPAIVQYIADLAPEKRLAPAAGSFERVRLQEWLNFISTELHKSFSPLFNPKAPEEWKAIMRELINRRIDAVVEKLGTRDYLMDDFSVADAYLFTVLGWGKWVDIDVTTRPTIVSYLARVAARPGVQRALKEEGLLK
jgi:glutathione S-transferase